MNFVSIGNNEKCSSSNIVKDNINLGTIEVRINSNSKNVCTNLDEKECDEISPYEESNFPLFTSDMGRMVEEIPSPEVVALGYRIIFPQIYNLRKHQESLGWDNSTLSLTQRGLGLDSMDRAHHLTLMQNGKDGTKSFRVRICRRCTGQVIIHFVILTSPRAKFKLDYRIKQLSWGLTLI